MSKYWENRRNKEIEKKEKIKRNFDKIEKIDDKEALRRAVLNKEVLDVEDKLKDMKK